MYANPPEKRKIGKETIEMSYDDINRISATTTPQRGMNQTNEESQNVTQDIEEQLKSVNKDKRCKELERFQIHMGLENVFLTYNPIVEFYQNFIPVTYDRFQNNNQNNGGVLIINGLGSSQNPTI